jgi:hypothetical protein
LIGVVMDQVMFNWAVGLSGALGGWILKVIWDAILELKKDLQRMDTKMHEDFVRRDDFKDAVTEIKADMKEGFRDVNNTLGLIFKKLDHKEDK